MPHFVSRDTSLNSQQKILYCEILNLSGRTGYCHATTDELCEAIGVLKETSRHIKYQISELKKKGLIQVENIGNERRIFPLRTLKKCLGAEIHTLKEFKGAEIRTPDPILKKCLGAEIHTQGCEKQHPRGAKNSTLPCIPISVKEEEKKIKEEVVQSAAARQPNTTLFFTTSFFERDPAKEEISLEVRSQLIETYGRDTVTKFEANALKAMIKSSEEGHANGKFYQRGLEEITRDFCEQEQKRKAARSELAAKKDEPIKVSLEDLVEIRKKKLLNDKFLSKFVTVDASGFFVKESKLSTQEYTSLTKTGMAFDDKGLIGVNSYDENFDRLERELRKIAGGGDVRGVNQTGRTAEPRRPKFFNTTALDASEYTKQGNHTNQACQLNSGQLRGLECDCL